MNKANHQSGNYQLGLFNEIGLPTPKKGTSVQYQQQKHNTTYLPHSKFDYTSETTLSSQYWKFNYF